jgi:hypothetical protein
LRTFNFSDIDHIVWEQSINDPVFDEHFPEEFITNNEYADNLTSIIPIESFDHIRNSTIDKIEPILFRNENHENNFIQESSNKTLVDQSSNVQHLTAIINDIHQTNHVQKQLLNIESKPKPLNRYQTHRIDKVSDLEIVKQGKGFKIGYIDRQGTDQRIILTKRIEADAEIMKRDPHVRLPYKGQRILNQIFSSVLYTNGYNSLQEDERFQHSAKDIEVPIIGTNPKHFDEV